MFMWRADTLLKLFQQHMRHVCPTVPDSTAPRTPSGNLSAVEKVAVDYAIIEKPETS